jgi:hypothetical protein
MEGVAVEGEEGEADGDILGLLASQFYVRGLKYCEEAREALSPLRAAQYSSYDILLTRFACARLETWTVCCHPFQFVSWHGRLQHGGLSWPWDVHFPNLLSAFGRT